MSSSTIFLVTLLCIFSGIGLGAFIRKRLPEHHLQPESKETVKLASGLIATLVALVLGLLVGSAKSTFDSANNALVQGGAKIIVLDRAMRHYGPETEPIRTLMREGFAAGVERVWPSGDKPSGNLGQFIASGGLDKLTNAMRNLKPADDNQRMLQSQMLQLVNDIEQSDWLLIEESQTGLTPAFMLVLIFWMTILYTSFSILAPQNPTALAALLISALCTAAAVFLIIEMSHPFGGFIKASPAPLKHALELMTR